MTVVIVDGLVEVMFRLTVLFLINIDPLLVLSARVSVKVGHGGHCDPVTSVCHIRNIGVIHIESQSRRPKTNLNLSTMVISRKH